MRGALASVALLAGVIASTASAQLVKPENNLDFLINGSFDLCPRMINEGDGFAFDLSAYGMKASTDHENMWDSEFRDGVAFMVLEQPARKCSVNFAGPEDTMRFLSQFMQETMIDNGFTKLDIDNPTDRPGSVHVRFNEDRSRRAQFTLVEGSDLLTISYTEKANF